MSKLAANHSTHRPDIDGLRAIAVLSVILFHIDETLLPGGFVGVDIFFVISGFLITRNILEDHERGRFSMGVGLILTLLLACRTDFPVLFAHPNHCPKQLASREQDRSNKL